MILGTRGYATEAARAAMAYAFENFAVDHLISLIRPENLPSRRVAEKNGLRIDREIDWRGIRHFVYAMGEKNSRIELDRAVSSLTLASPGLLPIFLFTQSTNNPILRFGDFHNVSLRKAKEAAIGIVDRH